MNTTLKIQSIKIVREIDPDPDLSHLGKYTDEPTPEAIIRLGEHRGKRVKEVSEDELPPKGRERRFFLPAMNAEESGNPESPKEDFERLEAWNDDWDMMGVTAMAVITGPKGLRHEVRSYGQWGIESDSSEEYFKEVEQEQLGELRQELLDLGFSAEEVRAAFVEHLETITP